jgi:hypothetical protein
MAAQIITPEKAKTALDYLASLPSEDRFALLMQAWDAYADPSDSEVTRAEVEDAALDIALALNK